MTEDTGNFNGFLHVTPTSRDISCNVAEGRDDYELCQIYGLHANDLSYPKRHHRSHND